MRHGNKCRGPYRGNWNDFPGNADVISWDSIELTQVGVDLYKMVQTPDMENMPPFSGGDCYSWNWNCGPMENRGGFSINLEGTGFELVDSTINVRGYHGTMCLNPLLSKSNHSALVSPGNMIFRTVQFVSKQFAAAGADRARLV